VLLAGGKTPVVNAAVVYHGSLLTREDIEAISAPVNFQQADPKLDNQIKTEFYNEVSCCCCCFSGDCRSDRCWLYVCVASVF
jgi:hypothetical protein